MRHNAPTFKKLVRAGTLRPAPLAGYLTPTATGW